MGNLKLIQNIAHFVIADLPELEREWRMEFYNWKYQAMEEWWNAFNAYQDATVAGCDAEGCK